MDLELASRDLDWDDRPDLTPRLADGVLPLEGAGTFLWGDAPSIVSPFFIACVDEMVMIVLYLDKEEERALLLPTTSTR